MTTNDETLAALLRKQPQPSPVAQPVKPVAKPRKATALFRGEHVDSVAVSLIRYLMIGVLALSYVGTVAAINGSWFPMRVESLVAGIGLQAFLTLIQWWKRRNKFSIPYLSSLGVDALLTFLGFRTLVVPFFVAGLTKLSVELSSATVVSLVVTGILAITVAVLPEQMLID